MSNHQGSQQTSEQFDMGAVELLQFTFNICGGCTFDFYNKFKLGFSYSPCLGMIPKTLHTMPGIVCNGIDLMPKYIYLKYIIYF